MKTAFYPAVYINGGRGGAGMSPRSVQRRAGREAGVRKSRHETKRPVARSYAVSFFLPLARLLFKTFLPFFVRILFLKPCSFFLCLTFG
jgi:hypothetical protein